jgi:tetratricopeptide (TPR) repeat protein
MIKLNPVFFLNGYQNLLEALFFIKQHDKFKQTLTSLIDITKEDWFPKDDNVESLTFLYVGSNKFNAHFMEGTFKEGLPLIPETLEGIRKHKTRIDEHHVMVFYYKIASLYFGIGEHQKCIDFLDKIISNKSLQMREDLLCFSRILNLVAHYEAGLDYNLEVLIKSTYKFLIKMEDLYLVQKEMITFLKKLGDIYPQEIKAAFKELHAKLKVFEDDPYEKRAFLYLDVLSWLESRIENKSVESIIRRKFLSLNKNN